MWHQRLHKEYDHRSVPVISCERGEDIIQTQLPALMRSLPKSTPTFRRSSLLQAVKSQARTKRVAEGIRKQKAEDLMETVTEMWKNGATTGVETYVQVTMQASSEEVRGATNDDHDNQQKLIKDTHAQLAVEFDAQEKT